MKIIFNVNDYDLWFNISRNIHGQEHVMEHSETSDTLCEPESGVFVGLDKLRPREDGDDLKSSKIAKKDENIQAKLKSSLKESISSFWKAKCKQRSFEGIDGVLKTDDRVVTFINDSPARGAVRYIGEEKDSTGNVYIIVGLELVSLLTCLFNQL